MVISPGKSWQAALPLPVVPGGGLMHTTTEIANVSYNSGAEWRFNGIRRPNSFSPASDVEKARFQEGFGLRSMVRQRPLPYIGR